MTPEQKRKLILKKCATNGGKITLDEATEQIKHCYYSNAKHYCGPIMSTLVRQGRLVRVKPGVFELPKSAPVKHLSSYRPQPDQLNLFSDLRTEK